MEALQSLDARQREAEAAEAKAVLASRADDIFRDKQSPVGGNVEGNVTMVEFFDYNCPYCRQVAPIMAQAVADDPQLRIVYKEFPILGPDFRVRGQGSARGRPARQVRGIPQGAVRRQDTG